MHSFDPKFNIDFEGILQSEFPSIDFISSGWLNFSSIALESSMETNEIVCSLFYFYLKLFFSPSLVLKMDFFWKISAMIFYISLGSIRLGTLKRMLL